MMKFFEWLRLRRDNKAIRKEAQENLKLLDEKTPEEAFKIAGEPSPPPPDPIINGYSVTGQYKTVKAMVQDAIAQKRKAKSAAQRISNSVGLAPSKTPPPEKK